MARGNHGGNAIFLSLLNAANDNNKQGRKSLNDRCYRHMLHAYLHTLMLANDQTLGGMTFTVVSWMERTQAQFVDVALLGAKSYSTPRAV